MSSTDRKRKPPLPVIDASLADRLCRGLLSLAESGPMLSERLVALGFAAHLPWRRFFESFAEGEAELLEYRTHRIEDAKRVLGRPWPPRGKISGASFFESEWVNALIQRRDRDNGVDEDHLSARYPTQEALWRRELTTCDRRRVQFEMERRDEYERRRRQAEEASRAVLVSEVARWATGVCGVRGADFRDPTESYVAAMHAHASRLGFQLDSAKSRRAAVPIFSRPVVAEWDLCWAMEQPQLFIGSPQEHLFSPDLQLRSRRSTGPADRLPYDRLLVFRYERAVPEFNRAYHVFNDFASLETIIRAHLALYELMAPHMEKTIRQCMLH
jgi:hypothetical protein